ncbi:protein wings apart-like isoform X2 [Condylostylus longicornis]|uniref:protein wings apart-like isoform X2 n=1 Tax=Condylostylus longicornis TaxID=2530218 RepID=UPI00244E38E1|nr:protein wings apart-like isoform X2 [Condylostylus longicornis]
MAFWGKNSIIVPLDTLINKEKETTSKPVAAIKSCGSVGRWGKMGFTSTRTYALKVPAHLSPVTTGQSPDQIGSPPGANNTSGGPGSSPPAVEAPKPKKFFKSRNTTAPLDFIRSQFMQHHMSHIAPISPGYTLNVTDALPPPSQTLTGKETTNTNIKVKISKSNKKRRESKEPKDEQNSTSNDGKDNLQGKERKERKKSTSSNDKQSLKSPKPLKKKKEEKQLKPEAPPSRVLGRSRKPVNYNEDDDSIPYRPSEVPTSNKKSSKLKTKSSADDTGSSNEAPESKTEKENENIPVADSKPDQVVNNKKKLNNKGTESDVKQDNLENEEKTVANKFNNINALDHPPIVLRISKGTSRLISTDSEEGKLNSTTPVHESITDSSAINIENKTETTPHDTLFETKDQSKISTTEELLSVLSDDKPEVQNITKKTRKKSVSTSAISQLPTTVPASTAHPILTSTETVQQKQDPPAPKIYPADTIPDINYESKISPDKPPKERLKLIIRTDVLRKALAAEAEKAEKKKEKEKNKKHHKHHHHHHHHKSLTLKISNSDAQFKTPSPQPVVVNDNNCDLYKQLTINSPSERDFDSQSSILGSVSSKATTAIGQFPAANVPEESCVIRSRGSSDITSDLETSQHSSLVAPPSDIESRLESMMDPEDDHTSNTAANGKRNISIKLKLIEQEPLKEDILEVLTGGNEKENTTIEEEKILDDSKNMNEISEVEQNIKDKSPPPAMKRPGRNRKNAQEKINEPSSIESSKEQSLDAILNTLSSPVKSIGRSLRGRANTAATPSTNMESATTESQTSKSPNKRSQRNVNKLEKVLNDTPAEAEDAEIPSKNTRTLRGQKSKTSTTEGQAPISIPTHNNEKKTIEKRGKKATAQTQKQKENFESIKVVDKDSKPEAQAIRSSKRNIKADNISSPPLSPTKLSSPVKSVKEESNLPQRKGRTPRKAALNNLKNNTQPQEAEVALTEVDDNLPEATTSVPIVRSYGGRKRKPQPDTVLTDITPPPLSKVPSTDTPDPSIDLPESTAIDISLKLIEDSSAIDTDIVSLEKDKDVDNSSSISDLSPQPPKKEYKVNKFKRAWYERDSKTNLENEKPLENTTEKSDFEDGEPLIKKSIPASTTTLNNTHEKMKSKSNNKIVNSNMETCSNIMGINSPDVNDNGNSNGNLDEKQIKLVISKKKGSIFKSRALVAEQGGMTSQEKKRHTYIHKWDAKDEQALANAATNNENKTAEKSQSSTTEKSNAMDYDEEDDQPLALSTRKVRQVTSVNVTNKISDNMDLAPGQTKVDKNTKEYYTVIRNVKTAHQIQEIGEYQEMDDDVEYILDALQPRNPSSTRCLSALQLATKCMTPAFRMHVRAHGTVTKFFKVLQDAKADKSLGLCTAAIMFVLSQDTLNMDLDRDSLELMMNLLESDSADAVDTANYERNKQKVRELCEEIKSHGKGAHLNIDSISAGTLAMETLLSLTSKRAGEWFKEELRELGGLEHIIKTICDCCHQISDYVVSWTEVLLEKLKTIERCLRVLENVSFLNEVNQTYILKYGNGHAVNTLFKLYKLCDSEIALYPTTDSTPKDNPGVVLREALVPTLKVLINLTHPFDEKALGSSILGQRKGVFDTSFHILLQAPNYVPERCIFELSILVLLLLINLTMHTIPNRQLIMQSHAPCDFGNQFDKQAAIKALIEYFYRCEEQARQAEKNTDSILENPLEKKKAQSQEEFDETVTKLLQKAGHHMEHTLQASYAGILVGHLISDNKENEQIIRSYLRDSSFSDIIKILEKYYNFMNLTASSEAHLVSHIKSTKKLIDYYKQCESHSNDENEKEINLSESSKSNINKSHHNDDANKTIYSDTSTVSSTSAEPAPSTSSVSTRNNIRVYKTYSQR